MSTTPETRVSDIGNDLLAIQLAYLTYPSRKEANRTITTFDICSRTRKFNKPGYNFLDDGLATTWTTEGWLEYRSHRLIVPTVGDEFRYHREPFGVDCQSIGSERVNVVGAEAIAAVMIGKTDEVGEGLIQIRNDVWGMAVDNWQGLVTGTYRAQRC
ncbi:MAG: hypothetical protein WDN66_04075 [Candidatus Saccharibacteria bacterium]